LDARRVLGEVPRIVPLVRRVVVPSHPNHAPPPRWPPGIQAATAIRQVTGPPSTPYHTAVTSERENDPQAEPLTKADFEALARFRFAVRRYLRFSEEAVRRFGLTPQQYQLLLAI